MRSDRAAQAVAVGPEDARNLQHAGIAGAVVADALAPAVVVAVQQDEVAGVVGAWDLGHRQLLHVPAGVERGGDGGGRALAREGDQLLAVGLVYGGRGDLGRRARSSGSGVPQMVETVPQWMRSPGLTAIAAMAPAASSPAMKFGQREPLDHRDLATGRRRGSVPAAGSRSSGVPPQASVMWMSSPVTPSGTEAAKAGGLAAKVYPPAVTLADDRE